MHEDQIMEMHEDLKRIERNETNEEIERIYDEIDCYNKRSQFDWIKIDGLKLMEGTEKEVAELVDMIQYRQEKVHKLRTHIDILQKYKDEKLA
tara:strand:- start:134 stop:412 length:279 start_codon:yes stop_codon:yes gene_type:complete